MLTDIDPGGTVAGMADICCSPLAGGALTDAEARALAQTFKALADPTRLRLLSMVLAGDGGEACVCQLTEPLGLTQPTVSHHLKVLKDAGLLTSERRGSWVWYAAVPEALAAAARTLALPITA